MSKFPCKSCGSPADYIFNNFWVCENTFCKYGSNYKISVSNQDLWGFIGSMSMQLPCFNNGDRLDVIRVTMDVEHFVDYLQKKHEETKEKLRYYIGTRDYSNDCALNIINGWHWPLRGGPVRPTDYENVVYDIRNTWLPRHVKQDYYWKASRGYKNN